MAFDHDYLDTLLDAILFAVYQTFSPGKPLIYSPGPISGIVQMLSEIGLYVQFVDDGLDVIRDHPIVRVRWRVADDLVTVVVEPAPLMLKALTVLGKEIQTGDKGSTND